jgi:hypothetical protein
MERTEMDDHIAKKSSTEEDLQESHPQDHEINEVEPVVVLSEDQIAEILSSLIVQIIGVEERLEDVTLRVYLVYKFYIYSPYSSWFFFKRYNDFIAVHQQVRIILNDHDEYSSFKEYEFPARHWYWTRDTVITLRTESFLNYVQRALRIQLLAPVMSHFIGLDEHYHEFKFQNTSSIISSSSKSIFYETPEEEDESHDSILITSSAGHGGYQYTNEYSSNFHSQHLKQSSPSPLAMNFLPTIQLQFISELLDNMTGPCLFSSLPLVAQTQRYQLGYATYRDGWNMTTLYKKIGLKSPLILLIRLLGDRCLIGAYISTPLGPPSYEFKGDSDCFVFKLSNDTIEKYTARVCDPEMIHYLKSQDDRNRSVSLDEGQRSTGSLIQNPPLQVRDELLSINDETLNHSKSREEDDMESKCSHGTNESGYNSTLYEFFYSNMEVIMFGGSEKLGTNAIRLSNDLSEFSSGPSDTYGNPCLIARPPDPQNHHDHEVHEDLEQMTVADIEIFVAVGVFGG